MTLLVEVKACLHAKKEVGLEQLVTSVASRFREIKGIVLRLMELVV